VVHRTECVTESAIRRVHSSYKNIGVTESLLQRNTNHELMRRTLQQIRGRKVCRNRSLGGASEQIGQISFRRALHRKPLVGTRM
jgi:hypothetical protein